MPSNSSEPVPDALAHSYLGAFAELIGLRLVSYDPDQVTASWEVTDALLQPYGLLHGGVHCSVVETLASIAAAVWLGDRGRVVGTTNTTDFFRAGRPGDRFVSTALPLHRGRSRQVWRVETLDEEGRLAAAGQVNIQNLVD